MPAYKSSQIVTDKSSFGKRYMPKLDKDGEPIRDPKKIFIGNMGSEISEYGRTLRQGAALEALPPL